MRYQAALHPVGGPSVRVGARAEAPAGHDEAVGDGTGVRHPRPRTLPGQKVRIAISAGAVRSDLISSSTLTSVSDAPAISSEVQYSPT